MRINNKKFTKDVTNNVINGVFIIEQSDYDDIEFIDSTGITIYLDKIVLSSSMDKMSDESYIYLKQELENAINEVCLELSERLNGNW